jgi:hypothetical protein
VSAGIGTESPGAETLGSADGIRGALVLGADSSVAAVEGDAVGDETDDSGAEEVPGPALHAASTSNACASAMERRDQRIEFPRDGQVPM